jgi:hypothetical protein
MAEKNQQLSPTSSESSQQSGSVKGSRSLTENDSAILIRKQPPPYVFSDEDFDVAFIVQTVDKTLNDRVPSVTDVPIEATLISASRRGRQKTLDNENGGLVLVEEPRMSAGEGKFRCRISQGSTPMKKGLSFRIQLSERRTEIEQGRGLTPVATSTVSLVNYKIFVAKGSDWADVFYKDEGGRDNSMEVVAGAYDRNRKVLRERIPLRLELCYVNGGVPVPVSNQDILRVICPESKLQIQKTTGTVKIRFRVEDVSKNHQGQDFVLMISPKGGEFNDIAPGISPAVTIRSKRNKRQREAINAMVTSDPGRSPTHASLPGTSSRKNRNLIFVGSEAARLQEAVYGIARWADEVVGGLYPLQWKVIGYATLPDGAPDYSHPYHNMRNPNSFIAKILSTYNQSTREQLKLLHHSVQHTNGQRPRLESLPPDSAAPGFPFSLPRGPNVRGDKLPPPRAKASMSMNHGQSSRYHSQLRNLPPPGRVSTLPSKSGNADDVDSIPRESAGPINQPLGRERSAQPTSAVDLTQDEDPDDLQQETDVEYILATAYKSLRTGERLGFPAYSAAMKLLGFYQESMTGTGQFVSLSCYTFGPQEIAEATEILTKAIAAKSEAVHALKDWGSIGNMLNHALVYEWSQGLNDTAQSTTEI